MKHDVLGDKLEGMVKRLLTEAKTEPFENKIDAIKLAIVWFSTSRKLGPQEDTSGSLLDEMRKAIDGSSTSGGGIGRGPAGSGIGGSPAVAAGGDADAE